MTCFAKFYIRGKKRVWQKVPECLLDLCWWRLMVVHVGNYSLQYGNVTHDTWAVASFGNIPWSFSSLSEYHMNIKDQYLTILMLEMVRLWPCIGPIWHFYGAVSHTQCTNKELYFRFSVHHLLCFNTHLFANDGFIISLFIKVCVYFISSVTTQFIISGFFYIFLW